MIRNMDVPTICAPGGAVLQRAAKRVPLRSLGIVGLTVRPVVGVARAMRLAVVVALAIVLGHLVAGSAALALAFTGLH